MAAAAGNKQRKTQKEMWHCGVSKLRRETKKNRCAVEWCEISFS
jgi:hypothetical protein